MPSPNEYREENLRNTALSGVAGGRSGMGSMTWLVVAGGIALAGYVLYSGLKGKQDSQDGNGDFNTIPFSPPNIKAESLPAPKPQVETIKIAPPPPPSSTPGTPGAIQSVSPTLPAQPPMTIAAPQEAVIPLPPQPPMTIAAPLAPQPAAALPALSTGEAPVAPERIIEQEDPWVRYKADSIVTDSSPDEASDDPMTPEEAALAAADKPDKNLAFMARVGGQPVKMEKAKQAQRIDAMIPQGTFIRGVLETAIQSDLAGMVRAVTTEDVYSFDGRRVLIPSGSRLIGQYQSGLDNGQTRVFIVWTRLMRSDGVSVALGSSGTDELGRAGMTGFVDNHLLQRYGSAILLTIVGGGTSFLQNWGFGTNGQLTTTSQTVNPDGTVTTTQTEDMGARARQDAADRVGETLTRMAQDTLKKNMDIPPTIHVDQGERIVVFVNRDLDFSAFYDDPVIEALRQVKRERGVAGSSISK